MSLRDNSSSANRSSTSDSRGNGSGGAGSAGGGNGGSNFTFRDYRSNPNISGNWNTGGNITGTGSMSRGITPVGQPRSPLSPAPVAAQPLRPMMPPPQIPPAIPPSTYPVPYQPVDVWGPNYRMDPGILAQMLGQPKIQPAGVNLRPSTFPARPGATTRMGLRDPTENYGNDMFGNAYGGFSNTRGNVGGGRGGGGGGGF
jgi:hypothetical protein